MSTKKENSFFETFFQILEEKFFYTSMDTFINIIGIERFRENARNFLYIFQVNKRAR